MEKEIVFDIPNISTYA